MNTRLTIWRYQLLMVIRNKQLLISFILLIGMALYAISYGMHFRDKQEGVIAEIDRKMAVNDSLARVFVAKVDTSHEIGRQNYKYRAMAADVIMKQFVSYRPSDFSALSIGQKDTYPFYHDVNTNNSLHSSVMQEMHNPNKLQAGNFDLSFIIIYLIPLLIISLSYNTISGERDLRTYTLLNIQLPIRKYIAYKMQFQFLLVLSLVLLLNVAGFFFSEISVYKNWHGILVWLCINVLYVLFWFAICYLVVSFNASSAVNALLLGSIWIMLVMLIPSAVNNASNPPNETEMIKSVFRRGRETDVHHELNDRQLLDSFYRLEHPYPVPVIRDPEYVDYMHAERELINREANMYAGRVLHRQKRQFKHVLAYGPVNPVFMTQYAFNQVAATELNSYHQYLQAAEEHQTARRYYIYDIMMNRKPFGMEEYERFPKFDFQHPAYSWGKMSKDLVPMALLIAGCFGIGIYQTRKRF